MTKRLMFTVAILGLAFGAHTALAECSINGTITASPNPDANGPAWMYSVEITWDTGTQYALSHMDIIMDVAGGTCSCQDFYDAIVFPDPIGTSDGDPSCSVDYYGEINCQGDPSIPGVDGIALKFEPYESEFCEPGPTGVANFVFYSPLGPAPIDEEFPALVDKYSTSYCFGHLTGDFPSMACDPVHDEGKSWGNVKGMYR
jgi:hypothetical protein